VPTCYLSSCCIISSAIRPRPSSSALAVFAENPPLRHVRVTATRLQRSVLTPCCRAPSHLFLPIAAPFPLPALGVQIYLDWFLCFFVTEQTKTDLCCFPLESVPSCCYDVLVWQSAGMLYVHFATACHPISGRQDFISSQICSMKARFGQGGVWFTALNNRGGGGNLGRDPLKLWCGEHRHDSCCGAVCGGIWWS
jgi:hypothetical protein